MASLPHVTAVLRDVGLIDTTWIPDSARDRGTAVHLATQYLDEGDLDDSSIADEIRPAVAAYQQFLAEVRPEIFAIEETVQGMGYVGTLDRRLVINGKEGVLDIKGICEAPWHALQLAAYALTFDRPLRRWSLYLRPEGYRLIERKDRRRDDAVWRACLTLATWRNEHGCS